MRQSAIRFVPLIVGGAAAADMFIFTTRHVTISPVYVVSYTIASRIMPFYQAEITISAPDIVSMSFDDKDKLVILLAIVLAALLYFKRAPSRLLPLPPGPKRLPLIGNLLNAPRTLEWETYAQWGKEFSACLLMWTFRWTGRLI